MADTIAVRRPADGSFLAKVPVVVARGVADAVDRARRAQPGWEAMGFRARAAGLRRLARAVRDDPELLETLLAESGKPRYEGEGMEVFYLLELVRFFGGRKARLALADEVRGHRLFLHKRSRIVQHPRGVVGVIAPFNWPLLSGFADCVAPLIAGNAVVLKPSELAPLTSLRVAHLWHAQGLPEGVFQVVTGDAATGRALVGLVDAVFFTGSEAAGRAIASSAGERLVPAVLELGGKAAMIVLDDAPLERAARAAVWSAFANGGQVCIRTERVLVDARVEARFLDLLAAETARLRHGPGPGGDRHDFDVGAMASARGVVACERQVADALARGARMVAGRGSREPGRPGHWLAPTVLAGCVPGMLVMDEETFGPVLPVMAFDDVEAAIAEANRTRHGLAASVWSNDRRQALAIARRLHAGSVCVNDVLVQYFCVEAPLGGVGASGLGFRHGALALRQFCRTETIVEDRPGLGWLAARISPALGFPYGERKLRLFRGFMRWWY